MDLTLYSFLLLRSFELRCGCNMQLNPVTLSIYFAFILYRATQGRGGRTVLHFLEQFGSFHISSLSGGEEQEEL